MFEAPWDNTEQCTYFCRQGDVKCELKFKASVEIYQRIWKMG